MLLSPHRLEQAQSMPSAPRRPPAARFPGPRSAVLPGCSVCVCGGSPRAAGTPVPPPARPRSRTMSPVRACGSCPGTGPGASGQSAIRSASEIVLGAGGGPHPPLPPSAARPHPRPPPTPTWKLGHRVKDAPQDGGDSNLSSREEGSGQGGGGWPGGRAGARGPSSPHRVRQGPSPRPGLTRTVPPPPVHAHRPPSICAGHTHCPPYTLGAKPPVPAVERNIPNAPARPRTSHLVTEVPGPQFPHPRGSCPRACRCIQVAGVTVRSRTEAPWGWGDPGWCTCTESQP